MQIELTDEYLASQRFSKTLPQRFWAKVEKNGPIPPHRPELGQCWVWTAALHVSGYAYINRGAVVDGRIHAHRVSWVLHYGPIPEGLDCLHHCDNPSCVRPSHLWLGTDQDNVNDCIQKGRANPCKGERNGRSKLTDDDVRKIRSLYPKIKGPELMRRFHVTCRVMYSVIARKSWKHI